MFSLKPLLFGNKNPTRTPHPQHPPTLLTLALVLLGRINLTCQYNISLAALSFIFVLDCLSLYFSGLFSFESLKNLFLPTESFQFCGMRFQLFFLSPCYVYREINIFLFGPWAPLNIFSVTFSPYLLLRLCCDSLWQPGFYLSLVSLAFYICFLGYLAWYYQISLLPSWRDCSVNKSAYHVNKGTWVQILRTHIKARHGSTSICHSRIFMERGEAVTRIS